MFWQRQDGVDAIAAPNLASHNRLWIHLESESLYLSTVYVNRIDWITTGESVVTLEGLLQKDRFLLDIWDKSPSFEVRTGLCSDPTDYTQGQRLMLMENLKSFAWWTENIVVRDEDSCTRLYCQFTCDWVEICDS